MEKDIARGQTKKMHVKQSPCQTRRMIFAASFEWVKANKITCVNC